MRGEQINDRSASRAPERAAHGCTARVRAPGVQILTSSSSSATASTGKFATKAYVQQQPQICLLQFAVHSVVGFGADICVSNGEGKNMDEVYSINELL